MNPMRDDVAREWLIPDVPGKSTLVELISTCRAGSVEHFHRIFDSAASPESIPPFSYLLLLACRSRNPEMIAHTLSLDAISPDDWIEQTWRSYDRLPPPCRNHYIYTAVLDIVANGTPAMMQPLLDAGLGLENKINTTDDRVDCLLERAITANQLAIAEQLLKHGASPNTLMLDGVLHSTASQAVICNSPKMLHLLLRYGGTLQDSFALRHAAYYGSIEAANMLLEAGADVNELFINDLSPHRSPVEPFRIIGTALHAAVEGENELAVRWLLEHRALTSIKDGQGRIVRELPRDSSKPS